MLKGLAAVLVAGVAAIPAAAQDPTPAEQALIYELNRARNNPQRYAAENGLGGLLDDVVPAPPLAWNPELSACARFKAQEMADYDYFEHQSPVTGKWPNRLARDHGYPLHEGLPDDANHIESIAAGLGETTLVALKRLIQDPATVPPGHRWHLLATGPDAPSFLLHREIGCGQGYKPLTTYTDYFAVHTGFRRVDTPWLTGVVFADRNANGRYDENEGLAGVTISVPGVGTTATNSGGGWSLAANPGTWTVECSGGGFVGVSMAEVTIDRANAEVDFQSARPVGVVDFGATPDWPEPGSPPYYDSGSGGGGCSGSTSGAAGDAAFPVFLAFAILLAVRSKGRLWWAAPALIVAVVGCGKDHDAGEPGGAGPRVPEVLFLADRATDGVMELWRTDLTGAEPTVLSGALPPGGSAYSFKWSPDRDRVAFVADTETVGIRALYLVRATGGTPVEVTGSEGVTSYSWAPDGTLIAFQVGGNVFTALPDGAQTLKTSGTLWVSGFSWAPDATRLAYRAIEQGGSAAELFTSLADGTGAAKASGPLAPGGSVTSYAWSPDGSRIAYRADQDVSLVYEVFSSFPDGTGNVKVSGALVPGGSVSIYLWSPDGARIAYRADRETDGVDELFAAGPDGTGTAKINGPLVPGGNVSSFGWAPGGSRIAYRADEESDEVQELFAADPDGGGRAKINGALPPGGDIAWYLWSPDGSRIAYVGDGEVDGVEELFTARPDGTDRAKVNGPLVQGGSVAIVTWSPDGSRIAYRGDADSDEVQELFVARPDGTGRAKVSGPLAPGGNVTYYLWTSDGSRVVYRADEETDEVHEVFAAAPDGIGRTKISGPMVSGGGVFMFFAVR